MEIEEIKTKICTKCKEEKDISPFGKSKNILAQVQRELNIKCGRNYRVKPVELSSADEAMKQEAIGSLAR
jgi:hypothetical protein